MNNVTARTYNNLLLSKHALAFAKPRPTHCCRFRQALRLEQRLLADVKSKVCMDINFVKEVAESGAENETEVTWTKFCYPRACIRWQHLRRSVPARVGVQEVIR